MSMNKDNLFKAPSATQGEDRIKHLEIGYKFDPKAKTYSVKITKLVFDKIGLVSSREVLTDVVMYHYATAKSHIDDILRLEGCD